jgi:hypothetical protein
MCSSFHRQGVVRNRLRFPELDFAVGNLQKAESEKAA